MCNTYYAFYSEWHYTEQTHARIMYLRVGRVYTYLCYIYLYAYRVIYLYIPIVLYI